MCACVCVCVCLCYSLLRGLKRGERKSASDPTTLTSKTNANILISILIERGRGGGEKGGEKKKERKRRKEKKIRNKGGNGWNNRRSPPRNTRKKNFDRSVRGRSLQWNDWANRWPPSSYIARIARIASSPHGFNAFRSSLRRRAVRKIARSNEIVEIIGE